MKNRFDNDLGNKEVLSANLQYLFNVTSKSQKELSDYLGVGKSTVTEWVKGRNYPTIDKLHGIAKFFGVDITVVVEDKKKPENIIPISKVKTIPILGEIACGDAIWTNENYDGYFSLDGSMDADFILVARGDSMIDAGIEDGDKCFIKKVEVVDNGKIAVVLLDDSATLKRVYRTETGWILQPENKDFMPIIIDGDIHILGELVGVYKTYL